MCGARCARPVSTMPRSVLLGGQPLVKISF